MKKKVEAIIDNAGRCPYFGYKASGLFEIVLALFKIPHKPKCYHPATSKPGYLRNCNCQYDKETDRYIIKDGCPLETVIDEETVKAVLKQQQYTAPAEPDEEAKEEEQP